MPISPPAAFNRRPLPQVIVPLAQATPAPTSAAQSGAAAGEASCDLDQSSSIPIYSPEVLSAPLRVSDVRMASAMGSQQGRMATATATVTASSEYRGGAGAALPTPSE